ncbi:NUDIX domain-containing protein [Nocardia sp. NPDC001965]
MNRASGPPKSFSSSKVETSSENAEPSPFQVLAAADRGRSGDGYVVPGVWGKFGAAGLIFRHVDDNGVETFLMTKTGPGFSQNNWQLPGGAKNELETTAQGAARETVEELKDIDQKYLDTAKPVGEHVARGPKGWTYTTHAATVPEKSGLTVDGHETVAAAWLTRAELMEMRANGEIHSALAKNLDDILGLF